MAVKPTNTPTDMSSGRRMAVGLNVTIAVVAAAALLIACNWISANANLRKDVAASGSYGLSERTKNILRDATDEIHISMLYQPDDQDDKQRGYIDRLRDYLDEMKTFAPKVVDWKHVSSDSKREELVATLTQSLGSEAEEHKKTLDAFAKLREELQADIKQKLDQVADLMGPGGSWLGEFPLFANVGALLRQDAQSLEKVKEDIAELTPANGIPKYAEATSKATTSLSELKDHLTKIADALSKLVPLADEATKPASENIAMLREMSGEVTKLGESLREPVGDGAPPADVRGALKTYADRCNEIAPKVQAMAQRIDGFAKKFPSVKQHNDWSATTSDGLFQRRIEVSGVLETCNQMAKESRLRVLGGLDSNKDEELTKALNTARKTASVIEQNIKACNSLLSSLADRLSKMDDKSKTLLEEARDGKMFKTRIAAITELEGKIKALPELKLSNVGDRIKEANSLVIEARKKVRVIAFNEVFPIRESIGGSNPDEEQRRTFNGDSAISTAIVSMTHDHPFATVVLTTFEPPAPQQRGPFSPQPPPARIPAKDMTILKQRLEAANFKAVEWNLANTEEAPKPEAGTEPVYIVFPPAPATPPNPFGGPPPDEKKFSDEQVNKIRDVLNKDGRVLFVASWDIQRAGMSMFGGGGFQPVPYGYGKLLEDDWGIRIDTGRRICSVVPDPKAPNSFGVTMTRFSYMPAIGFTDTDLGRPLKGTRFLVTDACPLVKAESTPSGVTLTKVLSIPEAETYIAAEIPDLLEIVQEIQNPESDGLVQLPIIHHGTFDIAMTGQRVDGDKKKGRIGVISFGTSIADFYLERPIPNDKGARLKFSPAPRESLDLVLNAIYWLGDQSKWISRGPVPTPYVQQIDKRNRPMLEILVYGAWPILVFAAGTFVWFIRRR